MKLLVSCTHDLVILLTYKARNQATKFTFSSHKSRRQTGTELRQRIAYIIHESYPDRQPEFWKGPNTGRSRKGTIIYCVYRCVIGLQCTFNINRRGLIEPDNLHPATGMVPSSSISTDHTRMTNNGQRHSCIAVSRSSDH